MQAPDADCVAQCEGCCGGSCTAEVNLDCQISCQAEGYAACQDAFVDECASNCTANGSIFCDGQYIDADDTDECIDALEAEGIRVETTVDLSGLFEGEAACAVQPGGKGGSWGALGILFGLGLFAMRRKS